MKRDGEPWMSPGDAMILLHELGAPARLLRHVELVGAVYAGDRCRNVAA